jgi:hypothetical protein
MIKFLAENLFVKFLYNVIYTNAYVIFKRTKNKIIPAFKCNHSTTSGNGTNDNQLRIIILIEPRRKFKIRLKDININNLRSRLFVGETPFDHRDEEIQIYITDKVAYHITLSKKEYENYKNKTLTISFNLFEEENVVAYNITII